MKNKQRILGLILVSILGFLTVVFSLPLATVASESEVNGPSLGIEPVYPDNQTDTRLSYFDLMMTPNQQQTISIQVTNGSSESVTVDLAYNGAKTSSQGNIQYGTTNIENDPSLQYDFVNLITGPETLEIPGNSTVSLDLALQMPEVAYDGVIAGGVTLTPSTSEATASSGSGGVVNNRYSYSISVLLRENMTELQPDLQFNRAYAEQQNFRNTIFVSLSNVIATYTNNLTIDAQISEQGSETILWESRKTAMRMAPNSSIAFPISMNGERMVAGMYTAHVKAYAGDLSWEWTEDFEITEDEADRFNALDVGLSQDRGLDWRLVAAIVGGVLAVILLAVLVIRQIRKNKKASKRKVIKKGQPRRK
ncbi:DUF916 and DUF3324 domain-containing protein [Enterococcus sp. LJL120]